METVGIHAGPPRQMKGAEAGLRQMVPLKQKPHGGTGGPALGFTGHVPFQSHLPCESTTVVITPGSQMGDHPEH